MLRLFLLLLCAGAAWGADADAPIASPIVDPEREGLELAARLRSSAPAEPAEFQGVLEGIARNGAVRRIPVHSRVLITSSNWQVSYHASSAALGIDDLLTIVHTAKGTNGYFLAKGTNAPSPATLTATFAGSDFWVEDLGLEFVHWPKQRALRAEMMRGQPCRVLESINPSPLPGSYGRVLAWIDLESGGVLQAEAYEAGKAKPLKKFSLGSFEKVKGRWQLRDMKMKSLRNGTQTDLKFELNRKAP